MKGLWKVKSLILLVALMVAPLSLTSQQTVTTTNPSIYNYTADCTTPGPSFTCLQTVLFPGGAGSVNFSQQTQFEKPAYSGSMTITLQETYQGSGAITNIPLDIEVLNIPSPDGFGPDAPQVHFTLSLSNPSITIPASLFPSDLIIIFTSGHFDDSVYPLGCSTYCGWQLNITTQ